MVLVNSNPATIMTDPDSADAVYIEPINWRTLGGSSKERPMHCCPLWAGRPALNCALDPGEGILERYGVEMVGGA